MAYTCVTVTATKDENIIEKIHKILKERDGLYNTRFSVRFIGFEAEAGTEFILNKSENKVPSSGYFITPYNGQTYMTINSLYFKEGCQLQNFYIIY